MTISEIKNKAQAIKQAFDKVQSNNELWEKTTRSTIESTLNNVKTETQLGWTVDGSNLDSVELYIKQEEEIAKLVFQLNHEGQVFVYATYTTPRFFPKSTSTAYSEFATVQLAIINPDVIYGYVGQFLDLIRDKYFTKPAVSLNKIASYLP